MTNPSFAQLAGLSAWLAAMMTVVGMVTLLLFFSRGGRWGRLNDAASVVLMPATRSACRRARVSIAPIPMTAVLGFGAVVGVWYLLTALVSANTAIHDGIRLASAVAGLGFISVGFGFARGGERDPIAATGGIVPFLASLVFQVWLGWELVSGRLVIPEWNL